MPIDLRDLLTKRTMGAMGTQPADPYTLIDRNNRQEHPLRPDSTEKGRGFLGALPVQNGLATEYSVADSERLRSSGAIRPDNPGGYEDYPTIVPTLTSAELNRVLNGQLDSGIYRKAEQHALKRRAQGRSLFAGMGEQDANVLPMFRRIQSMDALGNLTK